MKDTSGCHPGLTCLLGGDQLGGHGGDDLWPETSLLRGQDGGPQLRGSHAPRGGAGRPLHQATVTGHLRHTVSNITKHFNHST